MSNAKQISEAVAPVTASGTLTETFQAVLSEDLGDIVITFTGKGASILPPKSVWVALYKSDPSAKGFDLDGYVKHTSFYFEDRESGGNRLSVNWGSGYYVGIVRTRADNGEYSLIASAGPTEM